MDILTLGSEEGAEFRDAEVAVLVAPMVAHVVVAGKLFLFNEQFDLADVLSIELISDGLVEGPGAVLFKNDLGDDISMSFIPDVYGEDVAVDDSGGIITSVIAFAGVLWLAGEAAEGQKSGQQQC